MSGQQDPRQKWCADAHSLLDLRDANARDYQNVLKGAEALITAGKPPEFTDEDWAGIKHYLTTAKDGFKTQAGMKNAKKKIKAGINAPPSDAQLASFKLLKQAMDQIVEETDRKRVALDEIGRAHV